MVLNFLDLLINNFSDKFFSEFFSEADEADEQPLQGYYPLVVQAA